MVLNANTTEAMRSLPMPMRRACEYLAACISDIVEGRCTMRDVATMFGTLHQNAIGRYGKNDLMNYDMAGRALGFGSTNRKGLKRLLDSHNIQQVVLNNVKCGFKRSDIMALCDELGDDVGRRKQRQHNKEQKMRGNYMP